MKKTKSTVMTAALLSAALAMQSNLGGTLKIPAADADEEMPGVYGPPPAMQSPDVTEPDEPYPLPEYGPPPTYEVTPVPVYGAPVATGDLDSDGRISVADYAVLKSYLNGDNNYYFYNDAADLDMDGSITEKDLKMFERYLFGISSNLTDKIEEPASPSPSDEPEPHGTVYGPPPASPSVKPSVYGTVYGPPPAYYAPAKSVPSEKPDTDEKTEGQH